MYVWLQADFRLFGNDSLLEILIICTPVALSSGEKKGMSSEPILCKDRLRVRFL